MARTCGQNLGPDIRILSWGHVDVPTVLHTPFSSLATPPEIPDSLLFISKQLQDWFQMERITIPVEKPLKPE